MPKTTIGLYGIGLDTYWAQFPDLHDQLTGYQEEIADRIQSTHQHVKVINTGIIDNPVSARKAGERMRREGVDLIFLYVSTYALSSTVLPVVQRVGVPVIVLSLQPTKAIDYASFNALPGRQEKTGAWLAYCQACSAPEIANVFRRTGIDYYMVSGSLDDEEAWAHIDAWTRAAATPRRPGAKPRRSAGPLLQWDARRVQRPHRPLRYLRFPRRDLGNELPIAPPPGGHR